MNRLDLKYRTLFKEYGIDTPLRKAHFLAQLEAESGLVSKRENLNYSEEGLLKTFKKYFTPAQAKLYARKPEKIANRVYANRMGNGSENSGDGWKYRGAGFLQITGKDNFKALSKYVGVDYVNNPQLLLNESDAMIAALWYWKVNNLNKYADQDNIDKVSDMINIGRPTQTYGDAHGFEKRKEFLKKWKKELAI